MMSSVKTLKIFPLALFFMMLMPLSYSQSPLADFSMSRADFEKQALSSKADVWVVDFWASWCRPCVESIPYLKSLHKKYGAQNVRFISISWDDSEMDWKRTVERFQMPWQHIRITKADAAFFDKHFPHKGIPTAFVIRTDGKVKRVNGIGMLETTLQKALKARPS
jgi:thiol-disulfide isomerase/thioredoxin